MDVKELEHELADLKTKVDQQHHIIMVILNGSTLLNKRMDILEELAQALGAIVRLTSAQLDRHLELFRESGASSPPLSEPKSSVDTQRGIEVG